MVELIVAIGEWFGEVDNDESRDNTMNTVCGWLILHDVVINRMLKRMLLVMMKVLLVFLLMDVKLDMTMLSMMMMMLQIH